MISNKVVLTDERLFGFLGVLLGVILAVPATIALFLEDLEPGGYAVVTLFYGAAALLMFSRTCISYHKGRKILLVRRSFLGLGYTRRYPIDDYQSMGGDYLDGGPDYGSSDSMVTHFVHYTFVLYGKKGVKDLELYSVSGGRYGFFPAGKRFKRVAHKFLKHLPLKQERVGP